MLVLLAKYPLDRLGTILGATFCERFDQTGRAVLHRLSGYRRSAELLTLAEICLGLALFFSLVVVSLPFRRRRSGIIRHLKGVFVVGSG